MAKQIARKKKADQQVKPLRARRWLKRVTKSYHNCNWLQVAENMVDPLHMTFLHRFSPLTNVVDELPIFDKTEETEWGFVVHSTRQDQATRVSIISSSRR